MKKKKNHGVFRRLYILLSGTMLFMLLLLGGILLRYVKVEQEKSLEETAYRIKGSAENMGVELAAGSEALKTLSISSDIVNLASDEYQWNAYDRSQAIIRIQALIKSIKSASAAIASVRVIIPQAGIVVTENRTQRDWEKALEEVAQSDSYGILDEEDGRMLLRLIFPAKGIHDPAFIPDYVIEGEISESYLDNYLQNLCPDDKQMAFLTIEDRETIVPLCYGQTDRRKQELLLEKFRESGIKDGDNVRLRPQTYRVSREKLAGSDLTLYYLEPDNLLTMSLLRNLLWMGIATLMSVVLGVLAVRMTKNRLQVPLQEMTEAFWDVENGNLDREIHHEQEDEFHYLYEAFNRMIDQIKKQMDNIQEQSRLIQDMELLQLQAQINPHFLYNSFYLLRIMAKNEDYELIQDFVTSLAKYYRFLNKEAGKTVELAKEAEHMESYVSIQQVRFGDKIAVEIEPLPAELAQLRIPKLILQPLFENSYNYGVRNNLGGGLIRLRYLEEKPYLTIIVDDNGEEMTEEKAAEIQQKLDSEEKEDSAHALSNINRRIRLSYGDPCGVFCSVGEMGGLEVRIVLRTDVMLKE